MNARSRAALQRAVEEAQDRHRQNEARDALRREDEMQAATVAEAESIAHEAAGGAR